MKSTALESVVVGMAAREIGRHRALRPLLATALALAWLGLCFPPRLAAGASLALETLLGVQVLASLVFASLFVAWPMGAPDWPWAARRLGPVAISPARLVLSQALGQALVWFLFWLLLVAGELLGLALIPRLIQPAQAADLPWAEFLMASSLTALQGLWLQAMARTWASFMPAALAVIGLIVGVVAGHQLGFGPVDLNSAAGWLRPGLEYLGRSELPGAEGREFLTLAGLALLGALGFNLLAAWILGLRPGGLVDLEPRRPGE